MVSYEIENIEEFNGLIDKMNKVGSNRFIMGEMARIIKKFSKANFTLKGSGQYEPLQPKYQKTKARMKPSAPIMVYDGRLRDSIVGNTSDSIMKITEFTATVGTSVPYAKFHDEGTKNMPQRKSLFLTKKMVEQMVKIYEANIIKGIKTL